MWRIEANRMPGQATEAKYPGSMKDGVGKSLRGPIVGWRI